MIKHILNWTAFISIDSIGLAASSLDKVKRVVVVLV